MRVFFAVHDVRPHSGRFDVHILVRAASVFLCEHMRACAAIARFSIGFSSKTSLGEPGSPMDRIFIDFSLIFLRKSTSGAPRVLYMDAYTFTYITIVFIEFPLVL